MLIDLDTPLVGDAGVVPWRRFAFPDGQPHFVFDPDALRAPVDLVARIRNGNDLLDALLALDALRSALPATAPVTLNLPYLFGARMDRRIAPGQPASLAVVAAMLRTGLGEAGRLRVLDPHSPAALAALPGMEVLTSDKLVAYALERIAARHGEAPVVVAPDLGARPRVEAIVARLGIANPRIDCVKHRDSASGKLDGFRLAESKPAGGALLAGRVALIVDDLCDGGRTFSGVADVLRSAGARAVYLCVTHGVFSRGLDLPGIDGIFCTDSYAVPDATGYVIETDAEDPDMLHYRREGRVVLSVMTRFVARLLHG